MLSDLKYIEEKDKKAEEENINRFQYFKTMQTTLERGRDIRGSKGIKTGNRLVFNHHHRRNILLHSRSLIFITPVQFMFSIINLI